MTQTIWILKRAVESATSHKLLLVVNWVLFPHSFCRDRDHHLKTFKSVVPASKLVDWLLLQVKSMLIKSLKLDTIKTKYLLASLYCLSSEFVSVFTIRCPSSVSVATHSNQTSKQRPAVCYFSVVAIQWLFTSQSRKISHCLPYAYLITRAGSQIIISAPTSTQITSGQQCCSVLCMRRCKQALCLTNCVRHWLGFPGRLFDPRGCSDAGRRAVQQRLHAPWSVQLALAHTYIKCTQTRISAEVQFDVII